MDPLSLDQLAEMAGATLLNGNPEIRVTTLSKDTRTLAPGEVYIALRGLNFDGNVYAQDALDRGAAAVIVEDSARLSADRHPVMTVRDGLEALQRLAREWRTRLTLRALCITGSNGKTSTKEFAAAVLGAKHRVVKTHGNLNNHIGLPLSILSATTTHTAAVWELGMNHPGEIAPLAALARPDVAIITNVGVAHIENLGTREAIAKEKGMLAEAVSAEGVVILSADNDMTPSIAARTKARVVLAGLSGGELSAEDIVEQENGCAFTVIAGSERHPAWIGANGAHMVHNALLALAAGREFGVPLELGIKALEKARLAGGRLQRVDVDGVFFLDDTYNANPDSMEAALAVLRTIPGAGRRIAVLGRMGELGDYQRLGYERAGRAAGQGADVLVVVGDGLDVLCEAARSAGLDRIHEAPDSEAAARMLKSLARRGDIVLVKASRSAHLEDVISHFKS